MNIKALTQSKTIRWLLGIFLIIALVKGWEVFAQQKRRAILATGYMARVTCACYFNGKRSLKSCAEDGEPGTEIVQISINSQDNTITARVPLLATRQATHTPSLGCVLNPP